LSKHFTIVSLRKLFVTARVLFLYHLGTSMGMFSSCLPANITSYNDPPCTLSSLSKRKCRHDFETVYHPRQLQRSSFHDIQITTAVHRIQVFCGRSQTDSKAWSRPRVTFQLRFQGRPRQADSILAYKARSADIPARSFIRTSDSLTLQTLCRAWKVLCSSLY
jgi:hypothetical protein